MSIHGSSAPLPKSLRSSERGLKFAYKAEWRVFGFVAPFVGAWIEITLDIRCICCVTSLRSSERGLKLLYNATCKLY